MQFSAIYLMPLAASLAAAARCRRPAAVPAAGSSAAIPAAVPAAVPVAVPAAGSSAAIPAAVPAAGSSAAIPAAVPAAGSSTAAAGTSAAVTGTSTFYGGNLHGGTCSFTTYTLPSGVFGTAFSGSAWDTAASCGTCLEVTAKGKTIKVMVVDKCPECEPGHLDLFEDAWKALSPSSSDPMQTSYTRVPCGITSPLVLHNKSGTSPYWFSMQVVNANEAVAKLEVSTDAGQTWKATQRKDYNFFENPSGFGTSTVAVRVTGASGKAVTVQNVGVASDSQVKAASNF